MKAKLGVGVIAVVILVVCLVCVFSSIYNVPEGYAAAVYRFGALISIQRAPGMHAQTPFVSTTRLIDLREQSVEVPQNAYTKDTQTVEGLATKVNYVLDASKLDTIIRDIGVETVYDKIILPNVLSITKNTIGQYTADELVAHRAEMAQAIQNQLAEKLAPKGVVLTAFTIQNIDFEDSFEAAVRRKVEAEQMALEAKNKTLEIEEQGKQDVIKAKAAADAAKAAADAEAYSVREKAKAEAEAIQLINAQLQNSPSYVEYLRTTRWDGKLPVVQGEGTPIIDLRGQTTQTGSAATPNE